MSYQMTIEDPTKVVGQMLKVFYDHGQEVLKGVNLNWYDLADICRAGRCKIFVLWHDGQIVGYSFWLVGNDFMWAHKLRADELAVFVYKEHRGRPALRFLQFCEMKLRDAGYDKIVRYAQLDNPLSRVFEKMGYKKTEYLMVKEF